MRRASGAGRRKPSTLYMWIPQVETACIINIHFSGFETVIIFGLTTSVVCVTPFYPINKISKPEDSHLCKREHYSWNSSINEAAKSFSECEVQKRNMTLRSPCTVVLLTAVQGGCWHKPAKYFKTAKVLVPPTYSFSSGGPHQQKKKSFWKKKN